MKHCIILGMIQCGRYSVLCDSLHVSHYPTWGVLKEGGAFELHHGRDTLNEVAAFARDGVRSTNFHALSPADFQYIQREGEKNIFTFKLHNNYHRQSKIFPARFCMVY